MEEGGEDGKEEVGGDYFVPGLGVEYCDGVGGVVGCVASLLGVEEFLSCVGVHYIPSIHPTIRSFVRQRGMSESEEKE